MKNGKISILVLLGAFSLLMTGLLANGFFKAEATQPELVTICHATGSEENPYTEITAAYEAIYGVAGHFDEPGSTNDGHEDDYEGPCEGASPSPSPSPDASPDPSPSPVPCQQTREGCPSPTPSPTLTSVS